MRAAKIIDALPKVPRRCGSNSPSLPMLRTPRQDAWGCPEARKSKTCKDTFGDISLQFVHVCTTVSMYKYDQICTFSCQDIPARFFLAGDKRGISTKVLGEDAWQTLRDDPSTSNKTCSSLKGKGDWFHFHEWQCRIVATSVASQTHVWPRVQKCAFDQLDATSKQLQIRRLFGIMYL